MSTQGHNALLGSLGWAVYLAVSWTWCIGMFLPILLVRDYGLWGFVVFALPNMFGAAAMGWVLTRRESAARIINLLGPGVAAFSWITIAFHAFFLAAIFALARDAASSVQWFLPLAFAAAFWLGSRADARAAAAIVWLASVAIATLVLVRLGLPDLSAPRSDRSFAGVPALVWLAPACVFGFLLCPYLDATFLRARASTDASGSRLAFGAGFLLFFPVMILFTLAYAPVLLQQTGDGTALAGVLLHVFLQSGFTVGAHAREAPLAPRRWPVRTTAVVVLVVGCAVLGPSLRAVFEPSYRIFMGFYGLVFPLLVWMVLVPALRDDRKPGQRAWLAWALVLAVTLPGLAAGFLAEREWAIAPSIALALTGLLLTWPRGQGLSRTVPAATAPRTDRP